MVDGTHGRRCCTAHSTRTGERCKRAPINGGTVCHMHGGSAPQVKAKAADRLAELIDPAIRRLEHLIDDADTDSVRLAAVKDVLDRVGLGARQKVDIEVRIRVMAERLGLDPDEVLAEAQRILEPGDALTR
jgi:hypothetical protein